MPNPDSTPSTQPADEDSIEERKKLLLVLNTASQLAPEAASMKYPFQSKLLPLLTQIGLISTHYLDFAKSADSGGLSPLSWEGAGFLKLVIEGGAMGVDGLETTANYRVKQLLINDSSKILTDHLNNNSSLAKIGKGIWSGSPFFSPWGKQEFRAALQSTQFHKTMENAVTASFDGAPNPRATANSLREVFQNISDKAFFKTPEFPTDKVSEGISNSLKSEPGRLADLQKARVLSNIFKPLSTIILPAASVILDINSS